jgi:hypothetical protein
VRHLLILLVIGVPSAALAQSPRAAPWAGGWWLALGAEGVRFSAIASSTDGPPDAAAHLRPSRRTGVHLALAKGLGSWRAQLEAGWAQGGAEAGNESLAVRDKSLDLSRYRLAPGVERRVVVVGTGELALALAATFDLWRADGNTRPRVGGEGRVALRLPLGRVALENRLTAGVSGSPLDAEDVGEGFERTALSWLGFGVALWLPL